MEQDPGLETELTNRGVGWAIAIVVACIASLGLALVLVGFYFVLNEFNRELPAWVSIVGGVVVGLGFVAFTWLVATAIERSRNSSDTPTGARSEVTPIRRRSRAQ